MMMKNQMIKTIRKSNGNIAVSGRDLYRFLEIKTGFNHWIKRMINEYGFVNHSDYMVLVNNDQNRLGGRPKKEFIFNLDTAKEICMVQRNSLGRLARRYFIGIQKRYAKSKLPRNPERRLNYLINASIQDLNKRTTRLEHAVDSSMRITSTEQYQLKCENHRVVIKQLGGYNSLAYQKDSSRAFSQCWRDFKNHFDLPRYSDLPHVQFENGLAFLSSWHLHGQLLTDVNLTNDQITLGE